MVQLNIPMPKQCLDGNCPCLATLVLENDFIRACQAAHLRIIYHCERSNPLPDGWVNFKKPEWCPLREAVSDPYKNYEEEETHWDMSMAGLGGSY